MRPSNYNLLWRYLTSKAIARNIRKQFSVWPLIVSTKKQYCTCTSQLYHTHHNYEIHILFYQSNTLRISFTQMKWKRKQLHNNKKMLLSHTCMSEHMAPNSRNVSSIYTTGHHKELHQTQHIGRLENLAILGTPEIN